MERETKILASSGLVFVALLLVSMLINDFAIASNMVFIGLVVLIAPYYIYRFFEFKKIRSYEETFPSFLRDIAESQRAGLSTIQAINMAGRSDYGGLTEEIRKMANQLSWNIPLTKVLENFSKRVKRSKTITRSIFIIDQANKSGGNIEDTMDSLANNIESIKDVQEEKKALLSQQVVMMYAIFLIFLGISIALIKFLIPMLQTQIGGGEGNDVILSPIGMFSANPCEKCITESDPACFSCDMFFIISASFGFGEKEDPGAYYKSLFFAMILVQGFFCGLLVGQIGSDSVIGGIKHSFIMLMAGAFSFLIVIKLGFI